SGAWQGPAAVHDARTNGRFWVAMEACRMAAMGSDAAAEIVPEHSGSYPIRRQESGRSEAGPSCRLLDRYNLSNWMGLFSHRRIPVQVGAARRKPGYTAGKVARKGPFRLP